MAACCKKQGKTLCNRLQELYAEYRYYYDAQASYKLQGIAGKEKIKAIMDALRTGTSNPFENVAFWLQRDEEKVPPEIIDYAKGIADLPNTNLLKYRFHNGSWIAIRPSGTEPKLKLYCSIMTKGKEEAKEDFDRLKNQFEVLFRL